MNQVVDLAAVARPKLSHLDVLESEAIHILREVANECQRPALLFSGGKDSIVMLRLAEKAFRPAGFPFPLLLAWLAALLECALAAALLTGALFAEAALLAGGYVIFLAFAFHGPGRWAGSEAEFGFFVDHFTFLAGLLFAAVHGPGERLAVRRGLLWRRAG